MEYIHLTDDVYLSHHGIDGQRWGVRNGPPYPLSRSERKAIRAEKKRNKNVEIGKERLENRIKRANDLEDIDRLSRKVGWKNTVEAGEANKRISSIKDVTNEILESEVRTENLGDYTRKVRLADVILTSSAASSMAITGAGIVAGVLEAPVVVAGIPFALAGVSVKLGYDYYQRTKY